MKLLHTADWHLGKKLNNFERIDEQIEVMDEICQIADAENPDAILVAGDLFDNFNPSNQATALLYKTLKRLANNGKRAVVAIAGNHDAPEKINAPDMLAAECGIVFAGFPKCEIPKFNVINSFEITKSDKGFIEIQFPQTSVPLRLLLTPYPNEIRLNTKFEEDYKLQDYLKNHWQTLAEKYCSPSGVNVLVTHLYLTKEGTTPEQEDEDEKSILVGNAEIIYSSAIPKQVNYTALGHLHRRIMVDKNVVYSSSPLAYSFGEANQTKYVAIVELEPEKEAEVKFIPLTKGRKLLEAKFDNMTNALKWLEQNKEAYVKLTMISDTYLKPEEISQLRGMHERIVGIIPQPKNVDYISSSTNKKVDLNKSIPELFIDFFKYRNNQEPSQEIISLFNEVINFQPEEKRK